MTNQVFNQTQNVLAKNIFAGKHADENFANDNWTKFRIGAYVGLVGGFLSMFGAVFLTMFEYLSGEKSHSFWFCVAMFALLAIGAHCLDKLAELKKHRVLQS